MNCYFIKTYDMQGFQYQNIECYKMTVIIFMKQNIRYYNQTEDT